ncbi:5-methyltetrahydropteroyltriglutamate--homocysteine S-methyltransferase [Roseiarcaceae bacterium H3SJ34-1]|uniref:5-methyltetrahydropteroyltriglutamate-- homocysteine S-methyltransferase n=1 Tax=Terripilifer ovatus TaxID=3032367 RepID=UPI003AB9A66E|nr:5-methyltetrahydropteroyltriglutamate--homocysteine S-methyltransferase [Roseiarcaceae bacterium H3SJ34-1]
MRPQTANAPAKAIPFRADVVGSFMRPTRLNEARERLLGPQTPDQHLGPHDNAELRAIEDDCIRDVVAMQERAGLKSATDGEFRRRSWWLDLIMGWSGFAADRKGTTEMMWRNKSGATQPFSRLWVNGPIEWRDSATVRAFKFLKANTKLVPKVTLPAPILVHMYACGNKGILEGHYKDVDQFWDAVVAAYTKEVEALVAAGATYIQFDDTSIAFLCDPIHRETVARWGTPPDDLLKLYARKLNEVVNKVPSHVTVMLHQCRGNREANWGAEGGYDPVAEVLFNDIDVDGYFLEYDSERAGGFQPLRSLPKGKTAFLGIMSSKSPDLESVDFLKRRIDEAAKSAPLDQLAISPQCGFASSIGGRPMTDERQEEKLARLVEVARDVWR